ncbi:MAG: SprB repeat-containing protein [Flavobacteriales bacterium]|nr:SprB repeat-containing protein [Flavobacteriales bacterium]
MIRNHTLAVALLVTHFASAVTVSVSGTDATCGQCNGFITATAQGGIPPYAYLWSPAPPSGQGTPQVQGLCPGDYSVEVTDGLGSTAQADFTVLNNNNLLPGWGWEQRSDCQNSCSGWFQLSTTGMGGTAPYTVDFPFPQPIGNTDFMLMGLCAGQTMITITDANGCVGTAEAWISNSPIGSPFVPSTSPACSGQSNGSITVGATGDSYAYIRVTNATYDQYFEFLTFGPYTINGLPAGTYDVYWWDVNGINGPAPVYCTEAAIATVGSLPGPCGAVSGTVYHDADQDCAFNGFDLKQPYRVLSIAPGGAYAISDGNGHYQQNLDYGNYTIAQAPAPNEVQLCPTSNPTPFILNAGNTSATVDFANLSTVPHDLSVSLSGSNARPGFPTQVWITLQNNSAFPSGNVTLDLAFDGLLLNPLPASGQWVLGTIAPYGHITVGFTANVPANINLLGTVLSYTAAVSNTTSEANTANNVASLDVTITGSYDPNDKQGNTSSGLSPTQYFLAQDEWIDYTVRFQNTGTATAEMVVIRDDIDADLNIVSLEILGASHNFTPSFGEGRELVFTFENILLPDSAADFLGSQGFVKYRIKPNSDVTVGTMLENTANIYFDFNPAIVTNTTSHVVDFSTVVHGSSGDRIGIHPNPAHERVFMDTTPSEISAITMLGSDGRVVRSFDRAQVSLDLSGIRPGSYVLDITLRNLEHERQQLIIQ